jgi:nicotinamidase/pyrazinamidase
MFGCGTCGDVRSIHDAVAPGRASTLPYADGSPGRENPMGELPAYDEHSALLVVDVQNDFADPNGTLYVEGGEQIVPLVNREIDRAAAAGAVVVYTQDWHPPSTPHFEVHGGRWPVHCVRATWGADLHPELQVVGERIRKATGPEDGYSGFSVEHLPSGERRGTGLDGLLRSRAVERIVIVGLATDYCVKETALDGLRLEYDTTVLRDAVRAVELQPGDGAHALAAVSDAGARLR